MADRCSNPRRQAVAHAVLAALVLLQHLALPVHLAFEQHEFGVGLAGPASGELPATGVDQEADRNASRGDDGHPPHPVEEHEDDRFEAVFPGGVNGPVPALEPGARITTPALARCGVARPVTPREARAPPSRRGPESRAPPALG